MPRIKGVKYGEYRKVPVEERFWSKVDKNGPNGCWLWLASKRHDYGQFGVKGNYIEIAHRYSWILAYGPVPEGLCVLHRCDVPACVNPSHLFLGTREENAADRQSKGRTKVGKHFLGTDNKASKLNEKQVKQIRRKHRNGQSIHSLSREYHVSRPSIKAVLTRETWAWVK